MYTMILAFLDSVLWRISMIMFIGGLIFFAENKKVRFIFGGIAILIGIIALALNALSWIIQFYRM